MEKNYEEIDEFITDSFLQSLSAKKWADMVMKAEAKVVGEANGCDVMYDVGLMVVTYRSNRKINVRWNETEGYHIEGNFDMDGKSLNDFFWDATKETNEKWIKDGYELPEMWREAAVINFLKGMYRNIEMDGGIEGFSIKKLGD